MPPAEEHPALRSDFSSTKSGEEWKRDSGSSTASSATTIYEEEIDTPVLYEKEGLESAHQSSVLPAVVEQPDLAESPVVFGDDSARTIEQLLADAQRFSCDTNNPNNKSTQPEPLHPAAAPAPFSSRTLLPQDPLQNSLDSPKLTSPTTTTTTTPQRRLVRSFSFRVGASNRLKKKSITEMPRGSESSNDINTTTRPTSPISTMFSLSKRPSSRRNASSDSVVSRIGQKGPNFGQSSLDSAANNNNHDDAQAPHGPPPPPSPKRPATNHSSRTPDTNFAPISISIPTDSLLDDDFMTNVTFSKRGSIMFGGKRAISGENMPDNSTTETDSDAPHPTTSSAAKSKMNDATTSTKMDAAAANKSAEQPQQAMPRIRVLPADVERESVKVRSLYEAGDDFNWELGAPPSSTGERLAPTPEDPIEKEVHDSYGFLGFPGIFNRGLHRRLTSGFLFTVDSSPSSVAEAGPSTQQTHRISTSADSSARPHDLVRREYELAGGAEDWQDVDGADVDRYGFIRSHRLNTPTGSSSRRGRTTSRRRNVLTKRDPSELNSARVPNRKVSARSLHTQASEFSVASRRSSISTFRQAANLLPHNRDRRWADEAGEMLTHTPGITHITEDESAERLSEALKQKEWERAEKWRKMARVVKKGKDGEGMEFEFDTKNPKLIDRTWKGIPDRWRGAAWYSFLATSAKADKDAPTEEHLLAEFHRLQKESCEYDGQIDLDVPRTISQHIMFRRRYRGGQRLLFRVLHAVALYFSEIGYVQGMASLAATLLCYFDEEKAFVMMVRMWQLRGLEELYRPPGFEGLLACLKDFETRWLAGKDVAKKLVSWKEKKKKQHSWSTR